MQAGTESPCPLRPVPALPAAHPVSGSCKEAEAHSRWISAGLLSASCTDQLPALAEPKLPLKGQSLHAIITAKAPASLPRLCAYGVLVPVGSENHPPGQQGAHKHRGT